MIQRHCPSHVPGGQPSYSTHMHRRFVSEQSATSGVNYKHLALTQRSAREAGTRVRQQRLGKGVRKTLQRRLLLRGRSEEGRAYKFRLIVEIYTMPVISPQPPRTRLSNQGSLTLNATIGSLTRVRVNVVQAIYFVQNLSRSFSLVIRSLVFYAMGAILGPTGSNDLLAVTLSTNTIARAGVVRHVVLILLLPLHSLGESFAQYL